MFWGSQPELLTLQNIHLVRSDTKNCEGSGRDGSTWAKSDARTAMAQPGYSVQRSTNRCDWLLDSFLCYLVTLFEPQARVSLFLAYLQWLAIALFYGALISPHVLTALPLYSILTAFRNRFLIHNRIVCNRNFLKSLFSGPLVYLVTLCHV